MKWIFLLFLFINNFALAEDSNKLCNQLVKFSTSHVVNELNRLSNIWQRLSPTSNECSSDKSPQELIIEAIELEDKEMFNQALDKLEDNHLLKFMAKIAPDQDLKEGETELQAFRRFLNAKFKTLNQRLSSNEKILLKSHPVQTFLVFYQYNKALTYIKKNDPELHKVIKQPFKKGDAIRHMFINAIAARFGMAKFVKKFSTLREKSSGYINYEEKKWREFNEKDFDKFHPYSFKDLMTCNPKLSKEELTKIAHEKMLDRMVTNRMDIHNNAIGIKIGHNNPCSKISDIYKLVKKEYESGNAREVISSNGRCFDVTSNYGFSIETDESLDCYGETLLTQEKVLTPQKRKDRAQIDKFSCY